MQFDMHVSLQFTCTCASVVLYAGLPGWAIAAIAVGGTAGVAVVGGGVGFAVWKFVINKPYASSPTVLFFSHTSILKCKTESYGCTTAYLPPNVCAAGKWCPIPVTPSSRRTLEHTARCNKNCTFPFTCLSSIESNRISCFILILVFNSSFNDTNIHNQHTVHYSEVQFSTVQSVQSITIHDFKTFVCSFSVHVYCTSILHIDGKKITTLHLPKELDNKNQLSRTQQ